MKNNTPRKLVTTSLAICLFTILSEISINLVSDSAKNIEWFKRLGLGTTNLIVVLIVISVILLFLTYLHTKYSQSPEPITEVVEPEVKRLADSLKERYQKRYKSKLRERFEITLEVSESFESQYPHRFLERYSEDAKVSEAFAAINSAFEKRGRLLIVGNAGVGKTVLLLKLALNLLDKTDLTEQEAFPVIFNLASWSYKYETFEEWLVAALVSDYSLSKAFAKTLLEQNRIIFLLDGLDEVGGLEWWERSESRLHVKQFHPNRAIPILISIDASPIHIACLASLNEYLRDGRRAVICCRLEDYEKIKEKNEAAPVSAKTQILNLTKPQILRALHDAVEAKDIKHHAAASNLLRICEAEGNENLLEVLSSPFYFTIAMEIFDRQNLKDDELPKSPKEIETHLLERFVESSLNKSIIFKGEKSTKWLKWLARLMERKHFITFELADLQPDDLTTYRWLYNKCRALVVLLVVCLIGGLVGGSLYVFIFGLITLGSFKELPLSKGIEIDLMTKPDFTKLLSLDFWLELLLEVFVSIVAGLCLLIFYAFFFSGLFEMNKEMLFIALRFILSGVLCGILYTILLERLESLKNTAKMTIPSTPYQAIRRGFNLKFVFAFLISLTLLYFISVVGGLESYKQYINVKVMVVIAIVFPLISVIDTALFNHFILRFCLYVEDRMPLRYVTFLDYVAGLRILEKDGGQWRFQHQKLKEYFATLKG